MTVTKEIKRPSPEDAERCIRLRKTTKTGGQINLEEAKFVSKIFREFPHWYKETEHRIYLETHPAPWTLEKSNG